MLSQPSAANRPSASPTEEAAQGEEVSQEEADVDLHLHVCGLRLPSGDVSLRARCNERIGKSDENVWPVASMPVAKLAVAKCFT